MLPGAGRWWDQGRRAGCLRVRACVHCQGPVCITARPLPDIDKVMINLKTEEFVLDMNTLQALQQLLQWVGDFVLYLLASLPNQVWCPTPTPPRGGPSRSSQPRPLLTALPSPHSPALGSRPHDALQQHPPHPPRAQGQ